MEARIESEEPRDRDPRAGKRRRPNGPTVPSPATVVDQTGRVLIEREAEWLARLVNDPASFAAIEREVHEHARPAAVPSGRAARRDAVRGQARGGPDRWRSGARSDDCDDIARRREAQAAPVSPRVA